MVHADRQTDITKLIVAFRDFTNAAKNTEDVSVCTYGIKERSTNNSITNFYTNYVHCPTYVYI